MIDLTAGSITMRWYNEDYYEIWYWTLDFPEGFEQDFDMNDFIFSMVGCGKR